VRDALLIEALTAMRDASPLRPGLVYRMAPDFVLQHGTWCLPRPWYRKWGAGMPRCCFGNAIAFAVKHGWRYFEGYALPPREDRPILHAWNVDVSGGLIDATWRNRGRAYFGVEFAVGRADDATWNGNQCILDDRERGWPIFRQAWEGEPEGLEWEPSPALHLALELTGKATS
jgi:hypothetical protein